MAVLLVVPPLVTACPSTRICDGRAHEAVGARAKCTRGYFCCRYLASSPRERAFLDDDVTGGF